MPRESVKIVWNHLQWCIVQNYHFSYMPLRKLLTAIAKNPKNPGNLLVQNLEKLSLHTILTCSLRARACNFKFYYVDSTAHAYKLRLPLNSSSLVAFYMTTD